MEIRSVFVSSCCSLLVFGGASCPCGEPGRGLGNKISPVCGDSFYTLLPIDARGVHGNRSSYKTRGNLGPFAKTIARSWMCISSTTQEPNRSPTDGTPSPHAGLSRSQASRLSSVEHTLAGDSLILEARNVPQSQTHSCSQNTSLSTKSQLVPSLSPANLTPVMLLRTQGVPFRSSL